MTWDDLKWLLVIAAVLAMMVLGGLWLANN